MPINTTKQRSTSRDRSSAAANAQECSRPSRRSRISKLKPGQSVRCRKPRAKPRGASRQPSTGAPTPAAPRPRLEIIHGSMFSGKTTLLLHRLRDSVGIRTLAIRHVRDTRFQAGTLTSHDGMQHYGARVARSAGHIWTLVRSYHPNLLVIDEAQFYDAEELFNVIYAMLRAKITIVVAGLTYKYTGKRFSWVNRLRPWASKITELCATCSVCGDTASMQNLLPGGKVMNGTAADFAPVCRAHHRLPEAGNKGTTKPRSKGSDAPTSSVSSVPSVANSSPRKPKVGGA